MACLLWDNALSGRISPPEYSIIDGFGEERQAWGGDVRSGDPRNGFRLAPKIDFLTVAGGPESDGYHACSCPWQ